jgi:hypothetical protein
MLALGSNPTNEIEKDEPETRDERVNALARRAAVQRGRA